MGEPGQPGVQVVAVEVPLVQASRRMMLMAAAVRTCCRCVFVSLLGSGLGAVGDLQARPFNQSPQTTVHVTGSLGSCVADPTHTGGLLQFNGQGDLSCVTGRSTTGTAELMWGRFWYQYLRILLQSGSGSAPCARSGAGGHRNHRRRRLPERRYQDCVRP